MFFSRHGFVLDHPMPIGTTVSGQYCCALLQDMMRLTVCCKQPALPDHHVILLQDNVTTCSHRDVQNLVQRWGLEMLSHATYSPDLTPCDVITGCWHM
jgi:hypothetical protein